MYESEANSIVESVQQLPQDVVDRFSELNNRIQRRTVIAWGEHCTECGWPTCYSTCDLYSPREDRKCRRFMDGMVRIEAPESPNRYLVKIRFKRWGMLWARSNFDLVDPRRALRLESRDYRLGKTIQALPGVNLRRRVTWKRYVIKKRLASRYASQPRKPAYFVLECYNPGPKPIQLTLRIRSLISDHPFPRLVQLAPGFSQLRQLTEAPLPFQTLISAPVGFARIEVPFEKMASVLDLNAPFRIDLTPNEIEDGATLYLGVMDFVCMEPALTQAAQPHVASDEARKVKCVVWDLDNTLWNGTLAEDGLERLQLRPGMPDLIRALDQRGILQSVASKNNPDDALAALRKFGLDSWFLYPQISWSPKSEGVRAIAKALNIHIDTLLLIDDSEFELNEVRSACPGVRVLNAAECAGLLQRPELDVPVTAESAARRSLYQVEAVRAASAQSFGQDYLAFLRDCQITLEIRPLSDENLQRVHELTQRTNQLNFSGNRYSLEVLREIRNSAHLDTYVLSCRDRFGQYGVIGFSIVDRPRSKMTDLMFSCRIQSKRIEHAFLNYLIARYCAESGSDFYAIYRRTDRNAAAGKVFTDLGLVMLSEQGGVSQWAWHHDRPVFDEGVVHIQAHMHPPHTPMGDNGMLLTSGASPKEVESRRTAD